MNDLSISQEYFMCAVNEKGKIPGFHTEKLVCLVASGLLELQLENCISIENKKVTVIKALPESLSHLKPLYDFINQGRPVKIDKILEAYNYSVTDKRLTELMNSIGKPLVDMNLAEISKPGILSSKIGYQPKKEALHSVIGKIRSEMLEEGEVTEDVAALVILLDKSKCLKEYFSKFEQKEMKEKLTAIVKTPSGKLVKQMVEYVESMMAAITATLVFFN